MRTKLVLLTAIFFTVFLSCSKEIEEVSNLDQTHSQLRSGRTAGRSQSVVDISQTREKGKYNNPYYIGTIKAAYLKLKSLGQISATYNISPNALYVRYLPKDENDLPQTFYPDYIIQLTSGKTFIGDTKAGSTATEAKSRAEALQAYIKDQNAKGKNLVGGIIIKDDTKKWRVNQQDIYNYDKNDLTNWDYFDNII